MPPEKELLHAIRSYLKDRGLIGYIFTPETFAKSDTARYSHLFFAEDPYLEIKRTKHLITFIVKGSDVHAKTVKLDPPQPKIPDITNFDLNHPDSLQKIFEYAVSKKRK